MSEEPLHYDDAPLHMVRLCHFIEKSEERILQSNATLAKLGAAGIFTDQILVGPLIAYIGVKDLVRHLDADVFLRLFVKLIIKPLAARFPSTEEGRGVISGRFHSFRHAFCSRAVDSKISKMVILDWLGHKDSSLTRYYYGISNAESKRLTDSVKVR